MKNKLGKGTTHSVPRAIAPKTGNSGYRTLQGLLDTELHGGAITGVVCALLAIISDKELIKDTTDESKYTYGDASVKDISHPFFYTIEKIYSPTVELDDISKFIDYKLIPTGFEIILSSKYSDLCDLMLDTLDS